MRSFLQKILFLSVFFMVMGNCIHAEENNTVSKALQDYSYGAVSQQELTDPNKVQLALIANNKQYVLITAYLYAFSLIIITILMKITDHQARDIVTIIGLVSVIFGTILLVLIVDTTEALTAPMGIFGAIAGYLFGTAQKRRNSDE